MSFAFSPHSPLRHTYTSFRIPSHVLRRLHSNTARDLSGWTPRQYRLGRGIIWSCVGLSTAVFVLWQYALNPAVASTIQARGDRASADTQIRVRRFLQNNFVLSPGDRLRGRYWTVLTSAFSHQNTFHLLGNMFSLLAFSSALVPGITAPNLVGLMVGSAICGSVAHIYQQKSKPIWQQAGALGASAMVMGLGAAAAMLRPWQQVLLFGFVPMPMILLAPAYVGFDTYMLQSENSRIGHAAHLGGAAFGVIWYIILGRRFGGLLGRL